MRLLYITNSFPYPLTSGYLRHYYLIRELSRRHAVTLLSLTNPSFCNAHLRALAPYTERILSFPRLQGKSRTYRSALTNTQRLLGYEPAVYKMREAIEELATRECFDVALLSGKQTLPAVRTLGAVPIVADVCDVASVRIRGHMAYAEFRQAPGLFGKYLRMKRIEQRLIRRTSHLIFASCRDRDALRIDPAQSAAVVPNGVDLDYWYRSAPERDPARIVFTGAMHYSPNADAAERLIRDIFPRVRKVIPHAKLSVVGRDPQPKLLAAAAGQSGVTVTGFVEDVRPYLDRATVFAAPLRFGAGIQNKVLEAMAMGVHVVASPIAAGGLRTDGGQTPPIEVVEQEEAFAQAIIREMRLAATCPAPSPLTRQYVQQHFSWSESAHKLEQVLFRAMTRRASKRVSSSTPVPVGNAVAGTYHP